jgi:hypothetical protein
MSTPEGGQQPSARPPRPDASWLIEKFLGPSSRDRGPFGLLGLHPAHVEEDDVLAGLRARLQQTASHPEGFTPEADEVRLAIHAAAAQLLDHATRQAMIARWAPDVGGHRPGESQETLSPALSKTAPTQPSPCESAPPLSLRQLRISVRFVTSAHRQPAASNPRLRRGAIRAFALGATLFLRSR